RAAARRDCSAGSRPTGEQTTDAYATNGAAVTTGDVSVSVFEFWSGIGPSAVYSRATPHVSGSNWTPPTRACTGMSWMLRAALNSPYRSGPAAGAGTLTAPVRAGMGRG